MKRPNRTVHALAVLLFTTLAGLPRALAQTGTSVLQGVVNDASKKTPLEGAIVTVTSPALQVEQIAATDSSGFYRVPNLPPGKYLLRVDRDGYLPHERAEIALRADITLQVNVDLLTEASQAQQVVVIQRAHH
jgi:carboxypeptidase family protein